MIRGFLLSLARFVVAPIYTNRQAGENTVGSVGSNALFAERELMAKSSRVKTITPQSSSIKKHSSFW